MRGAIAAALGVAVLLGAACRSEPRPSPSARAVAVREVLREPAQFEAKEVTVAGTLVVGDDGGFLMQVGSTAPTRGGTVIVPVLRSQVEHLPCATVVANERDGTEIQIGAASVRGILRHDEERVFGPRPGYIAQLDVPVVSCG